MQVMTIINLTDDSFYAASRCPAPEEALRRVQTALDQGAGLIDLGACSTRPGSDPVSADTEWARLEPVLQALKTRFPQLPLSIDTFRPEVVCKARNLWGGFFWVNDVSGGAHPGLLPCIAQGGLGWIAMHNGASEPQTSGPQTSGPHNSEPQTSAPHTSGPHTSAPQSPQPSITQAVRTAFARFVQAAAAHGINRLMLDPGFGFHKDLDQNFELVRHLASLKVPDIPLLVGISRKRMTYQSTGTTPEGALAATSALHLQLLLAGADVLRVHDTLPAVQVCALARRLQS